MKRKDILAITAAVVVALTAVLIWLGPWAGEPAPEVSFTTLEGRQFQTSSLAGRPVLVTFWATTCVTCVAEIPHLKKLYKDLAPEGLEILGVAMSYDPPDQVRAMKAERDLNYTIVLDKDGRIAEAFGGVHVTPTTYLIDSAGRIVWRRLGELDMHAVHDEIAAMLAQRS